MRKLISNLGFSVNNVYIYNTVTGISQSGLYGDSHRWQLQVG